MPFNQGILLPIPMAQFLPKTQFGIAQLWFANRTPLTSRLPKLPVGNLSFNMVGYKFRPRVTALTANVAAGDGTLSLADVSLVMNGDVLQLSTGECVEVTAAPLIANATTGAGTLSVRRGIGTAQTIGPNTVTPVPPTAVADITAAGASVVKIIGNSRTGGEINQLAIAQLPNTVTQYVQTFQHIVQVAGVMQDIQGMPWPTATPGPWPKNKLDAMQNLMDDIEYSSLYGVGEAIGGLNSRSKQWGLTYLIQTNKVTAPTNPGAYKPTNFVGDALQPIRKNGGDPNLIFMSTDFMTGLATWGYPLQRFMAGDNGYGTPINTFYCPYLGPIPIVEAMWLAPMSALVLTKEEVRYRVLHDVDFQPYGRRGDTGPADNNGEGDWIGRMAIELDNEAHHSYVTGITGFAPQ